MGHQPKDVARIVENARDAPRRAIDFVEVAEGDAAFSLKSIQGCFVGLVIAVVMSNWKDNFLASIILCSEEALAVLDAERYRPADLGQPRVTHQRTGQETGFGQHLEAIANSNHRNAAAGSIDGRETG